jgi:hypothetical protein
MKTIKKSVKSVSKSPNKKIVKTKKIKSDVETRGRDTKYGKWMDGIAERLAKEGFSQKNIYNFLGITEASGIKYKKEYESFYKALENGYQNPIAVAERKLFKLVKGYEFDSEQIVVVSDGSQVGAHVERVPIKKRMEPNLRAIEFFLKNRKSWKQNPTDGWGELLEVTGKMEYKVIPDEILEDKNEYYNQ